MAKGAVRRDAFRGLFALYALKAHLDHRQDGEDQLLRLFGSSKDIPDSLLDLWSNRADILGAEAVGAVLSPRARDVANGRAVYDHASAFLRSVLRDLDQTDTDRRLVRD